MAKKKKKKKEETLKIKDFSERPMSSEMETSTVPSTGPGTKLEQVDQNLTVEKSGG